MSDAASKRSNLFTRLATALPLVPFILWMLYSGPQWAWVFPIVAGLVALTATHELFAMVAPTSRLTQVYGVLASAAVYVTFLSEPSAPALMGLMLGLTSAGLLGSLAVVHPTEQAAQRSAWSIAGPLYIGGMFATIVLLFRQPNGGSWVVLAMLCAFWSDTGGYFVGRAFGKHKLMESVSPKKTVEGSVGGLAAAVIGGLLAHFWFLPELPLVPAVVLSIVAALAGQAGDLCESLIKRSTDVKDSGSILPGHGGMLDRSDALMFCATTVWAYVTWLH